MTHVFRGLDKPTFFKCSRNYFNNEVYSFRNKPDLHFLEQKTWLYEFKMPTFQQFANETGSNNSQATGFKMYWFYFSLQDNQLPLWIQLFGDPVQNTKTDSTFHIPSLVKTLGSAVCKIEYNVVNAW